MSNRDLAENIYIALKDKGAEIGNASISIIERVLDKDATIAAQAARIEALTQALAIVEWGGTDQFGPHCPDCGNYKHIGVHLPDCELASFLAATPGAVPVVGAGTRAEVEG